MKKVALLFVLAVLIPSLALAFLAVRSLRDQQLVLERQQSLLYQGVAEGFAKDVSGQVIRHQRDFAQQVEQLLASRPPEDLARSFDTTLVRAWPVAEVGFAVALDGSILSPPLFGREDGRRFRLENERFLTSRETVDVHWDKSKDVEKSLALPSIAAEGKPTKETESAKSVFATKAGKIPALTVEETVPATNEIEVKAEFRELIGDATEGTIARFLQDTLKLLLWYRSPRDPGLVFGAQLDVHKLTAPLAPLLRLQAPLNEDVVVALLDESGQIAAASAPLPTGPRKLAAVVDVGQLLPHWQIGVFALHPERLQRSAHLLQLFLGLLVGVLVLAITMGGALMVIDLRRQLQTARQKTDFVSNVSHELKTPLTSIRMFSELLAEGRVHDEAKRQHYLQIITAETARLTRLINNVLDFSHLERGEKRYQFAPCDVVKLVDATVATYRPHLEEGGFQIHCHLPSTTLLVRADRDALAQVMVNLLSNAEKYAGSRKEILVEVEAITNAGLQDRVEVRISDRGLGIPAGCEEKIFEQFYRAHDSLASGIQGSGLGLTLARHIARSHQGDLTYRPRPGGGSSFIVSLPLVAPSGDGLDTKPPQPTSASAT